MTCVRVLIREILLGAGSAVCSQFGLIMSLVKETNKIVDELLMFGLKGPSVLHMCLKMPDVRHFLGQLIEVCLVSNI